MTTRRQRTSANAIGWLFIGPAVLGSLLLNVAPVVPMLLLSLTQWDGTSFQQPQYVGLRNFRRLFEDPYFIETVQRTLIFVAITVVLAMGTGLTLAMLVRTRSRFNGALRAIYFLPFITSQVAIGLVWQWVFDYDGGLVNELLGLVGIEGPRWLLEPPTAFAAVVIVTAWFFTGYNMVLFLSGLQRIPVALLEAATLDGAGPWRRFRYIIFPLISPTTFFILFINVLIIFDVFGLIYAMTGGGPGTSTEVYMYRLYNEAFEFFRLGYAAAMAMILMAILTVLSLVQFRLQRKWVFYQ